MHRDAVQFDPSHLLVMLTNSMPKASAYDDAVWRRLLKVPFDVTIPPDERDGELPAKLRDAGPAVLTWCWQGWVDYQAQGLNPPAAVRSATDAYRADNDLLGQFLDERCDVGALRNESATDLLQAFLAFCRDQGEHVEMSAKAFSGQLHRRGFEKVRARGGIRYQGLRLWNREVEVA